MYVSLNFIPNTDPCRDTGYNKIIHADESTTITRLEINGIQLILRLISILFLLLMSPKDISAQAKKTFTVIPLGIRGGSDESNLSAYLVGAYGENKYISLDAGTLHAGIKKAIDRGSFRNEASHILRTQIKGYYISHPHLDHLAGLILNSPEDSSKFIAGLPFCLDVIKEKYFSWKSWANFGDDGEAPLLRKYRYRVLKEGVSGAAENTSLSVTPFLLSHSSPYTSTAFLVSASDHHLLYLGDTGADSIEKSGQLKKLWQQVAGLVRSGKLKAIFIEVSFPNEQKDNQLFGHLTPRLLMEEMKTLREFCGRDALEKVSLIITHQKPGNDREIIIPRQLKAMNEMNLKLIFPEQGRAMYF